MTAPRNIAPAPESLFNERAEQNTLAAILLEPERFDEIADMAPSAFGLECHAWIYAALSRLAQNGGAITLETIAEQMRADGTFERAGGYGYLAALLASVPTAANIRADADIVREYHERRALAHLATEIAGMAYAKDRLPLGERITSARARLDAIKTNARKNSLPATWADLETVIAPVTWAWRGWLPIGQLTMVASEPGQGKSAFALRLAACFLRGDTLPDGSPFAGDIGAVIWCEAEAAQAVNLERARAWGLPLHNLLTPFPDPMTDIKLDNTEHQKAVSALMFHPDVTFMVVDSLRGVHRGDENSSETLTVVKWLAELARDTGKPILLTHHLRKRGLADGDGEITLDRLRGSTAITQTARVVWAIDTPNARTRTQKRLSVIKSNLARFPEALGFEIDADGLTFTNAPTTPKHETITDRAADLLLHLLRDGPQTAAAIQSEIEQAGLSWQAAKRAKDRLGIVSVKPGGIWHWSLPHEGG